MPSPWAASHPQHVLGNPGAPAAGPERLRSGGLRSGGSGFLLSWQALGGAACGGAVPSLTSLC